MELKKPLHRIVCSAFGTKASEKETFLDDNIFSASFQGLLGSTGVVSGFSKVFILDFELLLLSLVPVKFFDFHALHWYFARQFYDR